MKTAFLFRIWPYVAGLVFAAGMLVRSAIERQTGGANHDDPRNLFARARLLQATLLLLFAGHLAGLIFPERILLWNSVPSRLYVLEGLGFGIGITALIAWARLMWRHLGPSSESTAAQAADAVFLALLFTALSAGTLAATLYRWSSSWGVLTLTPYV